jgi:hypothetical protein
MSARATCFPSPASGLLSLAALALLALPLSAAPLTAPIHFDGAPAAITARGDSVVLNPGERYDPARGYGWSQAPSAAFPGEAS